MAPFRRPTAAKEAKNAMAPFREKSTAMAMIQPQIPTEDPRLPHVIRMPKQPVPAFSFNNSPRVHFQNTLPLNSNPTPCNCPFSLGTCTCDLCDYLKAGIDAHNRFISTERTSPSWLPNPQPSDRIFIWQTISMQVEEYNAHVRNGVVHKRHHGFVEDDIAAHYVYMWYEVSVHNEKLRTEFMKDGDVEGVKRRLKVLEECGCKALQEHRGKCEGVKDVINTVGGKSQQNGGAKTEVEGKEEKVMAKKRNDKKTITSKNSRRVMTFTADELEKENIQAEKDNERRLLGLSPTAPKARGRNGSARKPSDDKNATRGGKKIARAPVKKTTRGKPVATTKAKIMAAEEILDTIVVKSSKLAEVVEQSQPENFTQRTQDIPKEIMQQQIRKEETILEENIIGLLEEKHNASETMTASTQNLEMASYFRSSTIGETCIDPMLEIESPFVLEDDDSGYIQDCSGFISGGVIEGVVDSAVDKERIKIAGLPRGSIQEPHSSNLKQYNADGSMNITIPNMSVADDEFFSNGIDYGEHIPQTFYGGHESFYSQQPLKPFELSDFAGVGVGVGYPYLDEEQLKELETMKTLGGLVFEKYRDAGFDFGFVGVLEL